MAIQFVSGWNPDRAVVARQEMLASRRYCTVAPGQTIPPVANIPTFRWINQLQAGTCWGHAAVRLAESLGLAKGYDIFAICRMLVLFVGKQLEGGGNPTNGGAIIDALNAMTADKGAGIAHESLEAYSDSRWALGTKPSSAVYADAKPHHLVLPVDVTSDDDARVLIANGHPVAMGEWWPENFDDGVTFMKSIGHGRCGHAQVKCGYVMPGVFPNAEGEYGWWRVGNSHGLLYPPLPPEYAKCVPNYAPDTPTKTSDYWERFDLDTKLQSYGNYEYVSATDLDGIANKIVVPAMDDAFIV